MIKLRCVSKKYKNENIFALNNITLDFPDKGLIFICGDNGSGKTTLLNCISLLDEKYNGDIYFNNISYKEITSKEKNRLRRNYFSYVFQNNNLINSLKCKDNINISSYIFNQEKNNNFDDLPINRYPKQMSGGQQQKTAIYRAIKDDKNIIICDEPTASLDYDNTIYTFEKLKEISNDKLVICVSHNMELVEKYADRIIKLEDGRVIDDKIINEIACHQENDIKKSKLSILGLFKLNFSFIKKNIIKSFIFVLLMSILLLINLFFISYITFNPYKNVTDNINEISNYTPVYTVYTQYNGTDNQSLDVTMSKKIINDCNKFANGKYNMAILEYYDGISFIKNSGIPVNAGYIGKTTLMKYFGLKNYDPKKVNNISFTTDSLQTFNIRIIGTFFGSGIKCDYSTIENHQINRIGISGGLWLNDTFENEGIFTFNRSSLNKTYDKLKYFNKTVTYYPVSYINRLYGNYLKKQNLVLDDDSIIISKKLKSYNDVDEKKYFLNFDDFSNNDFLDKYINMNKIFNNGINIVKEVDLNITECSNNYVIVSDEKFEEIKNEYNIFTGITIYGNEKNEIANLFLKCNYNFKGDFVSRKVLNDIINIKNDISKVQNIINKTILILSILIISVSLLWIYLAYRFDKIKIALLRTFGLSKFQSIIPSMFSFLILNILSTTIVIIAFHFLRNIINSFLTVFNFDIEVLVLNTSVIITLVLFIIIQIIMFILYYFIVNINKTLKQAFD